ncbi:MAG: CRISPR-associated helicase Cas3', partial [Bryobacteraceae bacterium]
IASSFLVFDEVHTFEPRLGLQATLVLARRAVSLGLPVVLLSATLPASFIQALAQQLEAQVIEVQEDQVPTRRGRRVTVEIKPGSLNASTVLHYAKSHLKTLVVVNTVARAMAIYEGLRGRFDGVAILAHSRFYDDDRANKEALIVQHFSKEAPRQPALLVATQVVEVGLDISCDLLLTELAPTDALIQRAGRCARWGGTGRVIVFPELETPRPYDALIIEATTRALRERNLNGQTLSWRLETSLVDDVLGPYFEGLADPQSAGKVLASLAEAHFTANPGKAAKAVREALSVEIALHDDPRSLEQQVFGLPRCRVHPAVFQQFLHERRPRVWEVGIDRRPGDDYRPRVRVQPLRDGARLMPGGYYVVHPDHAGYDAELGLQLGAKGQSASPVLWLPRRPSPPAAENLETWTEHARRTVKAFEELLLPREVTVLPVLAIATGSGREELLCWVKLLLALHDIGKLTRDWQAAIRQGLEAPPPPSVLLVRRGGGRPLDLPAHATISAWVATPLLCRLAGSARKERLAVPSLAALAHHHCVRADEVPGFKMVAGWFQAVRDVVGELVACHVEENDFNTQPPQGSGSLNLGLSLLSPNPYTAYLLLSRWLRLADWMASGGGEDAVLRFEEWFRDT